MLNVLLESRAPSTRRIGGTVTSALIHGSIIAAAIAVTVPTKPVSASDGPKTPPTITYIAIPHPPEPVSPGAHRPPPDVPLPQAPPSAPALTFHGPDVPVIGEIVTTPSATPDTFGPGVATGSPIGEPTGLSGPPGAVVEERFVDRSPRLLGNSIQPTFPPALRLSGRGGRVLVQFVVDTTGRAEMEGFKVMDTTDPLFAESVRAALPRYRFSAGEAGGRKVRTLVQLPFDFTLR
ncbi:MAG: energy transducer TonB [bacterium]